MRETQSMRGAVRFPVRAHARGVLAVVLCALAGLSAAGAQVKDWKKIKFPAMRAFTVPQPERVALDNGMVILLLEDRELPLVEMTARIRTGSAVEPAAKAGLASVFGQVWRTGGTKTMDGDAIDDFLESRAAVVETGAGVSSTFATVSSLKEDFPEVLKVFNDILRNPVFDQEKIDIAVNLEKAGIARRNDDPTEIMQREFGKLVYGADSPYARTTEYATIGALTREDLLAFHRKYVAPNRIILGVRGDFRRDEMLAILKQTFGSWPAGSEVKDPKPAWRTTAAPGMNFIRKDDMTQSNIIMGHLGIEESNPDIFAVEVLNEAFGGSFSARLFNNVRTKKGLAYRVRGAVGSDFDHPGTFNAFMTTKVETTGAGIDALLEEISAIAGSKPPTAEEVQRAKESILESFVFNYDSTSEILAQQLTYEYYGFPADYLAKYRENIEKVTPEDVARVAKKYIHPDQLALLVVGPAEGQDKPLDTYGKVATIDITIPEPSAPEVPVATPASLKQGREVFARVVDGLGGAGAVDSFTAMKTLSDMTLTTPGGQFVLKVDATFALPDRVRQEVATPMGQILMLVNGTDGYMKQGPNEGPLPPNQREEILRSIWRNPLALAQKRDDAAFQAQHVGNEAIDGTPCDVLLVTLHGDMLKLWASQADGKVLRTQYRAPGPMGGPPGEHVMTFSDFRAVSGLTIPFKADGTFDGKPQRSSVIQEIVVNPPVDASLFTKAQTQAAGGP